MNKPFQDAQRATLGCVNSGDAKPIPSATVLPCAFATRRRIASFTKAVTDNHSKDSGLDATKYRINALFVLFGARKEVKYV